MKTFTGRASILRTMADASYDWEEWVDEDGTLRYVSPACKKITGYSSEELLANPLLEKEMVHPEDQAIFNSYLVQSTKDSTNSLEIEYRIIHRNGEVRWVELGSQPVIDAKGLFLGRRVSYRDITKSKNKEEELLQSHQIIQTLLQATTDAVTVIDTAGTILLWNQRLSHLLGINSAEIQGKNLWKFFPPGIAKFRKNIIDQAIQTGKVCRTEDRGENTNAYYDTIVYPISNDEGRVEKVIIWARDITERKKAEQEIRNQHQVLEALLNGLKEVFAVADLEGNLFLANQVMAQRLGVELDELIGKNISEVLPPDIAQMRKNIGYQVIQSGKPIRIQEQGKAGLYDSIYYPLLNEQGNVEKVAVLSYDLTEIKRAEEGLRKSEEKYRFLAENSNDVIWITDLNMKLIFISPAVEKLRGYTVEEAMQEPFDATLTPESLKRARQELQTWFEKEKRGTLEIKFSEPVQLEYTCKDGSTVWAESSVSLVRDSTGKLTGFMGTTRNISKRKQAEEALQRSEQLLRTVVNNAPVIIIAINEKDVITLAEGKVPSAVEFNSDDLVGKNVLELISSLPQGYKHIQRLMEHVEFIDQYKTRQGAVLEFRYKPLFDEQDNFKGAITVVGDVTEYTRVQEELRRSRNQLEVILNGVQDAINVLDAKGRLIFANQASSRRVSYQTTDAMLGDDGLYNAFDFFNEVGEPLTGDQLPGSSGQKGIPQAGKIYRYRIKRDGTERWVVISETPVFDETGKVEMAVLISHDISELKHAHEELQKAQEELEQRVEERTLELAQSNQQLRDEVELRKRYELAIRQKAAHSDALARVAARINTKFDLQSVMKTVCEETAVAMNYSGCAIMLFNEDKDSFETVANTLEFDPYRLASISREQYEVLLKAFGPVIVIPDISSMSIAPHQDLAAKRQTRTVVGVPLSQDGKMVGILSVYSIKDIHLPTEDEINLIRGFADQASIAIVKARLFEQISESHRRMQVLSEKLVIVQEEERRKLASELHDEIGQILTLLSLNCDMISRTLQNGNVDFVQINAQFDETKQMVNQLLNQVRQLSLELRPGILDDLGLLPALLDHFKHYSSQSNIEVQFKHHGLEGRYSTDIETTAFRIIQEALTNVARHAEVDTVSVHLWVDRELLKLKVEDQGVGFDLEAVEKANDSIGISSMRERAILCGGGLEIETVPGQGTCLIAELPLVSGLTRSENVHFDTISR